MEEEAKEADTYPKLLHFIPDERAWKLKVDTKVANHTKLVDQEERKLELKLGLPGEEEEEDKTEKKPSLLPLAYSSNASSSLSLGAKRGFSDAITSKSQQDYNARMGKELSLGTSLEREKNKQCKDTDATTKPQAISQNRNASAPVVGWPPVRSFRKNMASSSKQLPEPQNQETGANPKANGKETKFVKINMDGIPIGRKVDLNAYDSYEKLCLAVKELFKGFLEVQQDSLKGEDSEKEVEIFSRLLDGTGEYTLVYEDGDGDRVLVSDVPWRLFVLSAKRLRVLKSSELCRLASGSISRRKTTHC